MGVVLSSRRLCLVLHARRWSTALTLSAAATHTQHCCCLLLLLQGYLVGLTVQGVGYRLEPVADDVITAALAAKRGDESGAAADGSSGRDSSSRPRLLWEQEAEKSNIAYPHKQPAKAVRLKVGWFVCLVRVCGGEGGSGAEQPGQGLR
jgi:hypothetical protein